MSPEFLGDCAGLHGAHSGRYGGPPWRSVFVSSLRSLTKTGAPDKIKSACSADQRRSKTRLSLPILLGTVQRRPTPVSPDQRRC